MKTILRTLFILIAFATPVGANAVENSGQSLTKVESKYVCMINNALFDKVQIPVIIDDKTYYGCCPMCKAKLEGSVQARTATDPISGETVDKATAIIGAEASGAIHYFESEENLKKFGGNKKDGHSDHNH